MRTKVQIEKELLEAKERFKLYKREAKNYDGNDVAERYLFFTSMNQLIQGASQRVSKLEDELEQFTKINSCNKARIEKELLAATEKLESYREDAKSYNGDGGAERYMFLTSITQLINEASHRVSELEDELEQFSKMNSNIHLS